MRETSFYGYKENITFQNYGLKLRFKPGVVINYTADISAGNAETAGRGSGPAGIIDFKAGIEGVIAGDLEIFTLWKCKLEAGLKRGAFSSYENHTIDIEYSEDFASLALYAAKKYGNFIPYLGASFSYSEERYNEAVTGEKSKSQYSLFSLIYGLKYDPPGMFYLQAGSLNLPGKSFYLDTGIKY